MRRVAVTQRVVLDPVHGERRDALDHRWTPLLERAQLVPVLLPNALSDVEGFCERMGIEGLLLTGGNDLADLGTADAAPERDAVEAAALRFAVRHRLPVLGVCRGMQLLVRTFGGGLQPVEAHAGTSHSLIDQGFRFGPVPVSVGSYHRWGVRQADLPAALEAVAVSADGVIEAVQHTELPIVGIMWHPEREASVADGLRLLARVFGNGG